MMDKDFDGAAWATSHDSDFQSLIARARRKTKPKTEDTGTADQSPNHDLLASNVTDEPDPVPQAQQETPASPPSNRLVEVPCVDLEAEG